ncbi:hypothetical protein SEA_LINETTI_107 [Gordonia phage Linetti]|nr:hypothetical protein SEA_LINETTI_107 [Gordonia phage Linetti]
MFDTTTHRETYNHIVAALATIDQNHPCGEMPTDLHVECSNADLECIRLVIRDNHGVVHYRGELAYGEDVDEFTANVYDKVRFSVM